MKNVVVKISGTQNFGNNENDNTELVTTGHLEETEDGVVITYEETELTGMKGTITEIRIDKSGKVVLDRKGTVNSQLTFEEGKKNISYYDTRDGAFTVAIIANYVETDINEEEGTVEMSYKLEADGKIVGENEIKVNYGVEY